MTLAAFGIGGWEMVLILTVVLILFGAKRLPELAKGLGHGIKEFKKATRDVTDEIQRSVEDDHYNQPPPRKEIDYAQEHSAQPAHDVSATPVARTSDTAASAPKTDSNQSKA